MTIQKSITFITTILTFTILVDCARLPKPKPKLESIATVTMKPVEESKEEPLEIPINITESLDTLIIKSGIDVLSERNFDILAGKRVGLITNATGINRNYISTVDLLYKAPSVNLVALYGPEHGVRGDRAAGEKTSFFIDTKTNLPVYSLYGKTRKPTPEMLNNIDILVFDIQDIGCRSYTYISTMGLAMEAAAEQGIKMVVLDRPNPLGGNKIEGNLVENEYKSFVSQFPIPYVHSFTVGELAQFLNGETILSNGVHCDLTIVQMEGWTRDMTFEDTKLPWVLTSPHIPHKDSPLYYVSTGILGELGVFSIGVGYTLPFRMIGAPWIDSQTIADAMNSFGLKGVTFRPITFKPYYAHGTGEYINGIQVHLDNPSEVELMSIQFLFMQVHNQYYPDKKPFTLAKESRLSMFDKVMGTSTIRELFEINYQYEDIKEYLKKDISAFRKIAQKYYLYD